VVSFVCDLCGTPGRAPAPGIAQCTTCGRVALVEAAAASSAAPGPHAGASQDPFAPDEPTLLLEDEIVEPAPRLATLWVRPEAEDTPERVPAPVWPRRSLSRTMVAIAAGAALAVGGLAAFRAGWFGEDRDDGSVAVSPAPPSVAQPALASPSPPPAAAAAPHRSAVPSERLAAPSRRPAHAASRPRARDLAAGEEPFTPRIAALRNPAPADSRCVPRALRVRGDLAARLPEAVTVRFPVAATGEVGRVEVLRPATDDDVARAIEDAIRSCTFIPGADDDGRPTTLPVVMRIRFARD